MATPQPPVPVAANPVPADLALADPAPADAAPAKPAAAASPRKLPANLQVWVFTLLLIIAAARVGIMPVSGYSWILMMLILFTFVLLLGKWICGRPLGILVMERNLMSMSRFQMILWTLLILSAYLTIVMQRIHAGVPDALNVALDSKLWALMGISTASLIGTPLLLQSKKTQDPSQPTIDKAAQVLNEDSSAIDENRQGKLYSNPDPKDARFTDMFQGDQVDNTAYIDPAKLQMFLFTLVVAASYGYQIFGAMKGAPKDLAMPLVSNGMIALLGISHAGYLGSKTVG